MAWGEPATESVAMPKGVLPELFKDPEPRLVLPSKKFTVPLGIPPLPLTVAVKVTVLPIEAGLCDETTDVELGLRMTCESGAEVLPA